MREGLTLHCLADGVNGGDIVDHCADRRGDFGGRNNFARDLADDHLLVSGRVEVLKLKNFDIRAAFRNSLSQCGKLRVVVVLERNHAALYLQKLGKRGHNPDNLRCLFAHEIAVRSQQRLTFRAVCNQITEFAAELPVRRETRAAAADNSGCMNTSDQIHMRLPPHFFLGTETCSMLSMMPTIAISIGTSSRPKALRAVLPETTSTRSPMPAPTTSAAT